MVFAKCFLNSNCTHHLPTFSFVLLITWQIIPTGIVIYLKYNVIFYFIQSTSSTPSSQSSYNWNLEQRNNPALVNNPLQSSYSAVGTYSTSTSYSKPSSYSTPGTYSTPSSYNTSGTYNTPGAYSTFSAPSSVSTYSTPINVNSNTPPRNAYTSNHQQIIDKR